LQRHQAKEARAIPILLRPVEWHGAPFEHLEVLPTGGQPITMWENQDNAFANVVASIGRMVNVPRPDIAPFTLPRATDWQAHLLVCYNSTYKEGRGKELQRSEGR